VNHFSLGPIGAREGPGGGWRTDYLINYR
jgi:hypothetical protein